MEEVTVSTSEEGLLVVLDLLLALAGGIQSGCGEDTHGTAGHAVVETVRLLLLGGGGGSGLGLLHSESVELGRGGISDFLDVVANSVSKVLQCLTDWLKSVLKLLIEVLVLAAVLLGNLAKSAADGLGLRLDACEPLLELLLVGALECDFDILRIVGLFHVGLLHDEAADRLGVAELLGHESALGFLLRQFTECFAVDADAVEDDLSELLEGLLLSCLLGDVPFLKLGSPLGHHILNELLALSLAIFDGFFDLFELRNVELGGVGGEDALSLGLLSDIPHHFAVLLAGGFLGQDFHPLAPLPFCVPLLALDYLTVLLRVHACFGIPIVFHDRARVGSRHLAVRPGVFTSDVALLAPAFRERSPCATICDASVFATGLHSIPRFIACI